MAITTTTEALISLYQQEIRSNTEQIQQVITTENGFTVPLQDGSEYKLYGIQETLEYFNGPINKLDAKIIEINVKIVGLQKTILSVGQTANDCGCGGLGINTITAYADGLQYRGYTYTSPNPYAEIDGTLNTGNIGIGTEDIIVPISLGVYYGDVGVARTTLPVCPGVTNCTGYATSISNLNSQITPLQTERNGLMQKLNFLKAERSQFQIRKYGFDRQKEDLNKEISSSNSIISFLQDPANDEWL